MTKPTRYIVVGGCGILVAGLAAGTVAFVQGGFQGLTGAATIPNELRYFPDSANVVAYADIRGVMASDLRRRFREATPESEGQREFESQTGIDLEQDIDQVVACLVPGSGEPEGLLIASGRFETDQLTQLARQHGGTVGLPRRAGRDQAHW